MGNHRQGGARDMRFRRIARAASLLCVSLLGGVALTLLCLDESGWWKQAADATTGGPLLNLASSEVRLLTFTTPTSSLTAQRSMPAARFAVQITYSDNRVPVHCVVSADLAGVLASLEAARVKKPISRRQLNDKHAVALGYLEARDAVITEPMLPWSLWTTHDQSAVFVEQRSTVFDTDLEAQVISRLESLCRT
jgi:hypothetical protein